MGHGLMQPEMSHIDIAAMLPRPVTNTPEVRALCERLVPGGVPAIVLLGEEPPPYAAESDCFNIVQRITSDHGGEAVYGWQLWETLPGLMIEAEAHAVWRSSSDVLYDYTPKLFPYDHIVFLEDPALVYEGRQIDNMRVPLTDDPRVKELIAAAKAYYEATNRGDLADKHGLIVATPEIKAADARRKRAEMAVAEKHFRL
jgi:hypothetical protein